jgi:hypothetical protein
MFLMEDDRFKQLDTYEAAASSFTKSFVAQSGNSGHGKAYVLGRKSCPDYCAGQMRSIFRRKGIESEVGVLSNGSVPEDGLVFDLDEFVEQYIGGSSGGRDGV